MRLAKDEVSVPLKWQRTSYSMNMRVSCNVKDGALEGGKRIEAGGSDQYMYQGKLVELFLPFGRRMILLDKIRTWCEGFVAFPMMMVSTIKLGRLDIIPCFRDANHHSIWGREAALRKRRLRGQGCT